MLICNVNFLSRDTCYFYSWLVDFLSKVQASSKTFVAGTIFSGYSIAEEFMTFPRYVQERRGMAFLSNLLDLMNVRLYYFLCTIHLLSVKMESVHLLWHMACNRILWRYMMVSSFYGAICRSFFESCGFGDDSMGSTTMMYTKSMQK